MNVFYRVLKRFFDLVFSFFGMIFLLLVIPFIKIRYMLSSDFNTIFYKQYRFGQNGKIFKLYKFRTMVTDADILLEDILNEKKYKDQWNKNQKLEYDPRVTKVGRFLRSSCLDEVPQFINVFKGEMSIVGPRPYLEREKKLLKSNIKIITKVKPGLTGYWQVNRENYTSFKSRMKLEKYYANNCSLIFDVKILFLTIKMFIKKIFKIS